MRLGPLASSWWVLSPSHSALRTSTEPHLRIIKAGDYIASTSGRGPDGKLRALEVHFLPPGVNEGQFAWGLDPDSHMTNATVAGVAAAPQGQVLKVTYQGQEADITVPPEVPWSPSCLGT